MGKLASPADWLLYCLDRSDRIMLLMLRDKLAVRQSPTFLRLALGFVYLHFGLLKFFPDLSPAELIATQTVMSVSFHWFDAHTALFALAVLETAIGLGLIFNVFPRITFALFMLHMAGTFSPLLLLPEFTFKIAPFAPNIEGQYICKNIVFIAAGWTVLLPSILPRAQSTDVECDSPHDFAAIAREPHHETVPT